MSAEAFQLMDGIKIDDSFVKRDFVKLYHHHGTRVDEENQIIFFHFGENLNHIPTGNSCLELEVMVYKNIRTNFTGTDEIRLVNIAFAYVNQETGLSTPNRKEIEENNNVGPNPTSRRLLPHADRLSSTCFNKIDETRDGIVNSSKYF